MAKRILAWVLLVGFVLLLLNISVFHIYTIPSMAIYLIIAFGFIFSNKGLHSRSKLADRDNPDNEIEKNKNIRE